MIMYKLLLNILTKKLNATVICLLFLIGVYELTDLYASFITKGLQYDLFVHTLGLILINQIKMRFIWVRGLAKF